MNASCTARIAALVLASALVTGCATAPVAVPERVQVTLTRADEAFALTRLPAIDPAVLFALPPDLEARLQQQRLRSVSHQARLAALLDTIFGADRRKFSYGAEGSTGAVQTWAAGRGDCLSLTILTYSAARVMGLNVQMQEVRVPAIYDRRPGVDFVNRHVNLAVHLRNDTMQDMLRTRVAIIDFEPQLTGGELGRPLDEGEIVARFHNNVGSEALAAGDAARAYAHYRAAVTADPQYAAAHSNLAVVLQQRGLVREAEVLLRHAISLGNQPEVALAALHRLLLAQQRTAEAEVVAGQLRAAQDADPYHWITEGVDALNQGHSRQAIAALEHAQQLTNGFTELHGWLALAYWQLGDGVRARQQLAQLEAQQSGSPLAGKLRRKLATP